MFPIALQVGAILLGGLVGGVTLGQFVWLITRKKPR